MTNEITTAQMLECLDCNDAEGHPWMCAKEIHGTNPPCIERDALKAEVERLRKQVHRLERAIDETGRLDSERIHSAREKK